MRLDKRCPRCKGSGKVRRLGRRVQCRSCEGSGRVMKRWWRAYYNTYSRLRYGPPEA